MIKRTRHLSLALFTICFICFTSAFASPLGKPKDLSRGMPKGLRIYRYNWGRGAVFYLAEMERKQKNLHFRMSVARGQVLGREQVHRTAQRATADGTNVLVAINASFGTLHGTYEGVIHDIHVEKGEIVSHPYPAPWTSFGVTKEGKFLMGDVRLKAEMRIAGQNMNIQGINGEGNRYSPMLYTPKFGSSTRTYGNYEIILKDVKLPVTSGYKSSFTVAGINKRGNTRIPQDGLVLSIRRNTAWLSKLKSGTKGELEVSFFPDEWDNLIDAVGGNFRLVKDGQILPQIRRGYRFRKADPRTALGYNDEKLFLLVADGRQHGYSSGMSMYDVAQAMIELGAKEVINLDGGSSSTFIAGRRLINRPSGGRQRYILNSMFIISDDATQVSSGQVAQTQRVDKIPKNALRVLALAGSKSDEEYYSLREFTSIDNQRIYYQQTLDTNLSALSKANILWLGHNEIRGSDYNFNHTTEGRIKNFVRNGGIVIVSGQDSDKKVPCPTGWIPEKLVGVERPRRIAFKPTKAAGDLFRKPHTIRRMFIDDTWVQWGKNFEVLATSSDGDDMVIGTLPYGKGLYLVTSLKNRTQTHIEYNKNMMENLLYFAVKWLKSKRR